MSEELIEFKETEVGPNASELEGRWAFWLIVHESDGLYYMRRMFMKGTKRHVKLDHPGFGCFSGQEIKEFAQEAAIVGAMILIKNQNATVAPSEAPL